MANFDIAYANTNKNEGQYANNPNDKGGETYGGISRKNWPNWGGWKYVDEATKKYKSVVAINQYLLANQTVQSLKAEFYKTNFWYPLNLQLINDQQLANNVYDFGVNAGIGASVRRLQTAINTLCQGTTVDGQIGNQTITNANKLNAKMLYDAFNHERKKYYDNIIANNPSQAEFKTSWYSRIKPYQIS